MPTDAPTRPRLVEILFLVGMLAVLAALIIPAVFAARQAARRSECADNLRRLSGGVINYSTATRRFPMGTSGSRDLLPEERFSWYLPLWPYLQGKPPTLLVDQNQPWDAEVNRLPKLRQVYGWAEPTEGTEDRPLEHLRMFSCPSVSPEQKVLGIQVTQYIGMAGIGADSPTFDSHQPGAGIWGYDRQIKADDIEDGISSTILLFETNRDTGPWIAGGPPTVRGLDLDGVPHFGVGGQFGGIHTTCPVAMADGSVRELNNETDIDVFSAMTTIAGRD
jgi:type II secretory pathway pseudopilin PulG